MYIYSNCGRKSNLRQVKMMPKKGERKTEEVKRKKNRTFQLNTWRRSVWSDGRLTLWTQDCLFFLGFDFRLQHHLRRTANEGKGLKPGSSSHISPFLWYTEECKCWNYGLQSVKNHLFRCNKADNNRKKTKDSLLFSLINNFSWQRSGAVSDCPKWLITADKHTNKPV